MTPETRPAVVERLRCEALKEVTAYMSGLLEGAISAALAADDARRAALSSPEPPSAEMPTAEEMWRRTTRPLKAEPLSNPAEASGFAESLLCERGPEPASIQAETQSRIRERFGREMTPRELAQADRLAHHSRRDSDHALALNRWPEERVYTITVFREEDGRYAADYRAERGNEGGMGEYAATPIGALADLVSTLLQVEEDKRIERNPR